jgi:hypothetical protein
MSMSQRTLNNVDPRFRRAGFAQQLQLAIDLEQELKADLNTVISDFNTAITAVNVLATTIGKLAALVNAQRGSPHLKADATNVTTAPAPTAASNQTVTDTYLNDLKDQMQAHMLMINPVHIAADATNTIADETYPDATDLATSRVLVNGLKAKWNAHIALAAATGHFQPDTKNAAIAGTDVNESSGTLAQVITLTLEIKTCFDGHIAAHALITGSQQAAIAAAEYAAAVQTAASVTATEPSDLT